MTSRLGTGKSITFFYSVVISLHIVPAGEGGGGAHHTVSGWGRRCGNRARSSQTPCTGGQSSRPPGSPWVGCYSSPPVPVTSKFSFTKISLCPAPIKMFRMLFWEHMQNVSSLTSLLFFLLFSKPSTFCYMQCWKNFQDTMLVLERNRHMAHKVLFCTSLIYSLVIIKKE